jgi:hypothetical protein
MSEEVKPKVIRRKKALIAQIPVQETTTTPVFPAHLDKLKSKNVIVDGHMWGGINPVTKEEIWLPISTETH